MPTFLGKSFNTYFKNILAINQSTNTGVDTVARTIQDGAGNNTSTAISDDLFIVIPQVDNGTATFRVNNQGGSAILAVTRQIQKFLSEHHKLHPLHNMPISAFIIQIMQV